MQYMECKRIMTTFSICHHISPSSVLLEKLICNGEISGVHWSSLLNNGLLIDAVGSLLQQINGCHVCHVPYALYINSWIPIQEKEQLYMYGVWQSKQLYMYGVWPSMYRYLLVAHTCITSAWTYWAYISMMLASIWVFLDARTQHVMVVFWSYDACIHLGIFVVSGYECAYIPMMLVHIWWVVLDAHIQMVIHPHDTCTCLGLFFAKTTKIGLIILLK